jgi:hypothetical protein
MFGPIGCSMKRVLADQGLPDKVVGRIRTRCRSDITVRGDGDCGAERADQR